MNADDVGELILPLVALVSNYSQWLTHIVENMSKKSCKATECCILHNSLDLDLKQMTWLNRIGFSLTCTLSF